MSRQLKAAEIAADAAKKAAEAAEAANKATLDGIADDNRARVEIESSAIRVERMSQWNGETFAADGADRFGLCSFYLTNNGRRPATSGIIKVAKILSDVAICASDEAIIKAPHYLQSGVTIHVGGQDFFEVEFPNTLLPEDVAAVRAGRKFLSTVVWFGYEDGYGETRVSWWWLAYDPRINRLTLLSKRTD